MYNLTEIYEGKKDFFLIIFKLIIIILFFLNINVKNGEIYILKTTFRKYIHKFDNIQIFFNHSLLLNKKEELLKLLSKNIGKNITFVQNIFIETKTSFGELLTILTKIISYCKILECKKIILDKNIFWFISNKINIKKYKIIIKVDNKWNIQGLNIIIDKTLNSLFYFNYNNPENEINYLKNEILKNLPIVIINPKELFIYIKSGDIFINYNSLYYIQPPLCFYKKILYNFFLFTNITIISENNKNIIINKILSEFPNITFNTISSQYNIAYLTKAYNMVGGNCNLLYFIIRLNDNLKNVWEFESQYFNILTNNTYLILLFYIELTFSIGHGRKLLILSIIYKINNMNINLEKGIRFSNSKKVLLHKMIASKNYQKVMMGKENTFNKLYLMLNFECKDNFTIIQY